MLALQKTKSASILSEPIGGQPVENLLTKEWLLTNGRGSYASSTIIGCNTRRYHGLLIGTLEPPTNRIMALANCLEIIICNGTAFNLSTLEFSDRFTPAGFNYIKKFHQDIGVHFDYDLGNLKLTKSIYLVRDVDTVAVEYDWTSVQEPAEFVLRPFVGLRDFHSLQKSYPDKSGLSSKWVGDGLLVGKDRQDSCQLFLSCPAAKFELDQQWWFDFVYRIDRERGQDFTEDLWTPGFFRCRIDLPTRIVLWATLGSRIENEARLVGFDIDSVREDLHNHQNAIVAATKKNRDQKLKILYLAADQFVVKRNSNRASKTTILAGYPWFADWGRDTFIALPGLLLSTGRFDQARSVLATFAQAADGGMIPNYFDDRTAAAQFNSVDASLWFINAAFQYLTATADSTTFMQDFMPVIRWIIDSYDKGTRFGIHADADGLIAAGDNHTQLTWMDAKFAGAAFTPRCGKAVEVNALWFNALCRLAQFYTTRDLEIARRYKSMADKVEANFGKLFWNGEFGYLNDRILPNGSPDPTLRPNQIFAVSLPFSPLSADQQKSVVDVVEKYLLTPYGLRTLNAGDSRYKSKYTGPQQQRDEAYHQGTVWPYLIGPFVESYLKVNGFSRKSKKKAATFIQPLLEHLTKDACLGSISEIFDGDYPHTPRGCFAQAWSVAELIRAYHLIND
jgi:predicted glycogen debranching enzyme